MLYYGYKIGQCLDEGRVKIHGEVVEDEFFSDPHMVYSQDIFGRLWEAKIRRSMQFIRMTNLWESLYG